MGDLPKNFGRVEPISEAQFEARLGALVSLALSQGNAAITGFAIERLANALGLVIASGAPYPMIDRR